MGHQQQQQQDTAAKSEPEGADKRAPSTGRPEAGENVAARAQSAGLGDLPPTGRSKSGEASGLLRDTGFYSPASSMAGSPHAAGVVTIQVEGLSCHCLFFSSPAALSGCPRSAAGAGCACFSCVSTPGRCLSRVWHGSLDREWVMVSPRMWLLTAK